MPGLVHRQAVRLGGGNRQHTQSCAIFVVVVFVLIIIITFVIPNERGGGFSWQIFLTVLDSRVGNGARSCGVVVDDQSIHHHSWAVMIRLQKQS